MLRKHYGHGPLPPLRKPRMHMNGKVKKSLVKNLFLLSIVKRLCKWVIHSAKNKIRKAPKTYK
jgi:hypothetical protein